MRKVTRQSIKDADIDIKRVENRLFEIAEAIQINNKNNLTINCMILILFQCL